MIKIDPVTHLDIVSGILRSKYLAVFFFALALGMYAIPLLGTIFHFLLGIFVYLFPFYLFFTLLINRKVRWAVALVLWMLLSLIPMQIGTDIRYIQYLLEYLPLLSLLVFCIMLNFRLKSWGYRSGSERFPLWF